MSVGPFTSSPVAGVVSIHWPPVCRSATSGHQFFTSVASPLNERTLRQRARGREGEAVRASSDPGVSGPINTADRFVTNPPAPSPVLIPYRRQRRRRRRRRREIASSSGTIYGTRAVQPALHA